MTVDEKREGANGEFIEENDIAEETVAENDVGTQQDDWQDRFLRTLAEFDNYKKRTQKEREMLWKEAGAEVILKILPLIDNLSRAVGSEVVSEDANLLKEGIGAILKQLMDTLAGMDVSKIEAVGQKFDPNLHEAVMHIEDAAYGENEVVEELLAGYVYGDRVIRHSMVKVAN